VLQLRDEMAVGLMLGGGGIETAVAADHASVDVLDCPMVHGVEVVGLPLRSAFAVRHRGT